MNEATILDLEALANETLDAIPDAPDFNTPPTGEYVLTITDSAIDKYTKKDDPNTTKQRLKNTYRIDETLSTANNEPPVPNGSLFTETFMATEMGLSFFKKRIKEIMNVENVTGVTLADMMTSVKGTQFKARISIKKTPKKDVPGEFYENLQIRVVKAA